MSHQKNGYVHPLFDPTSNYRVASRGPVWGRDGGRGSVKRFFLDHLRDVYLQWPMSDAPEEIPQGIFPPDVYEFHWHQSQPVTQKEPEPHGRSRAIAGADGHPEAGVRPGVVRLNLESPGPISRPAIVARYQDYFAGDNKDVDLNHESDDFWVEIPDLLPRRRCLVLILSYDLQIAIAGVCDQKAWLRSDESAAILAITEALGKMLGGEAEPERELAFRLAALFSLAPGLEGSTDSKGVFSVKRFKLSHAKCRRMPDDHLLFCCTGPVQLSEVSV